MKLRSFFFYFFVDVVVATIIFGLMYLLGEVFIFGDVLPESGISVEMWENSYVGCLQASCVVGAVLSLIWYILGIFHDGVSSIYIKYFIFLGLNLAAGITIQISFLLTNLDGVMGAFLISITSLLIFFITSAIASPDAVSVF